MATDQEQLEAKTDPRIPTARCRGTGCDAEIIWVLTPAGKWTPVDAKPVRIYVLEIDQRVENSTGLAGRPGKLVSGHVPHWATCPAAKEFGRATT